MMTLDDLQSPMIEQHLEKMRDALRRGESLRFAYDDSVKLYRLAKAHNVFVPDELNELRLRLAKARIPEINRIKDAWYRSGDNPTYAAALDDLRAGDWRLVVNMLRARYPLDFDAFAQFFAQHSPRPGPDGNQDVATVGQFIRKQIENYRQHRQVNRVPKLVIDRYVEEAYEQHGVEIEQLHAWLHRARRQVPATYEDALKSPHWLAELFYRQTPLQDGDFDRLADFIKERFPVTINGRPVEYWEKLAANRADLVWKSYVHSHGKKKMSAARKPAIVASVCREVREMYGCGLIDVQAVLDLLNRPASRRRMDSATTP